MTKRIVAVSLVLVLVLSLCATAFASYFPTASFASGSKNKLIKHGKVFTLKVKCKQGTGPFYEVFTYDHGWVYRAGLTVVASRGSWSQELADCSFTGNPTYKAKFTTKTIRKPASMDTYKLAATSWYRPTYGNIIDLTWRKYKTKKTNLYILR